MRVLAICLLSAVTCIGQIIAEIRYKISAGDLTSADAIADEFCRTAGPTTECADAVSWLARGALYLHEPARCRTYLERSRDLTTKLLQNTKAEDDAYLAAAIGAGIEVESQLLVREGRRDNAIQLLNIALGRWELWSIKARVQKDLNLLTLEGRPAPVLPQEDKGKPVLFFLWGHWCSDCTAQAPVLRRLHERFPQLAIIAPTRRNGTVGDNEHATPEQEDSEIERVWKLSYAGLEDIPHPVDLVTQLAYGVSSTPTLVLLDRFGIVRLYCPFRMSETALATRIKPILAN
jgi:thiol-disulfide isomerase/thioredoxin